MKKYRIRTTLKKTGCMILTAVTILTVGSVNVYAEAGSEAVMDAEQIVKDASADDPEVTMDQEIVTDPEVVMNQENVIDPDAATDPEGVDIEQTEKEEETDSKETTENQKTVDLQIAADEQDIIDDEDTSDDSEDPDEETVEKKNGVVIEDGVYHYYIDNVMQKWLITDANGDRYYAGSDGVLARNKVVKFNDTSIGWLYFGADGKAKKWLITTPDGSRYYAGSDGALVRNKVIKFNDTSIGWLYFGADGKAKKWLITTPNGDRYYAGSDGALVRDKVIRFNDKSIGWLYFGADGKAKKWLITTPDGDKYYAGADGALVRNKLIKFNDDKPGWLYFGNDGKAAKAKIVVVGDKYYYATRVDGRIMRTKGWIELDGKKYFAGDGGVLLRNVWITIGGFRYHFNSSGVNDNIPSITIPAGLGTVYTLTYYSTKGFVFVPSMRTSISSGSNQERVWKAWKAAGAKYDNGLAVINNAYLVAVTSTFGEVGDMLRITYRSGYTMYAVIADEKSQTYVAWDSNPANMYGHNNGKNVVEFEVDPTYYVKYNNPGTPSLWNSDLKNSGGVAKIEKLGHKY